MKTSLRQTFISIAIGCTGPAVTTAALANDQTAIKPPEAAASATATAMTEGEVRKVDAGGGKLTLKHGEIKNLEMPPMTMVFVVKDKAMLGTLKVGDRVNFRAVKEAGNYTVTELRMVN